jgi:hypothetical protein
VFNLLPDTRLALNEFVCDANGTSHSALFGVTRGTFAFMTGRVAESRCLTVDTPVGSIRGRAHSSGIGMLSLTALTFAMIGEVHATDPDVTILDDDSISYKDLEHGVFELVTKEPIPRHILVEDPGKTIVLHKRGSSVSVSQDTNTAARMEELHAAQRDVLANFAQGIGASGSSTPPSSVNSLPVQRINFISTDVLTVHFAPAATGDPAPVPEVLIVHPPPPPPRRQR